MFKLWFIYRIRIQWNLHIAPPLYNGHFSQERMKWRSNSHNKTPMYRTLYSEHLSIVDIIFRFQLTLQPRTNLLIADTSNIRHFLQEICIHFTFDNVLQFRLSSLQSLLFYFLASLMAFSGPWKCRDCKFVRITSLYSSLWLTCFLVAKMTKA